MLLYTGYLTNAQYAGIGGKNVCITLKPKVMEIPNSACDLVYTKIFDENKI